MSDPKFTDLFVIGGGINGCGIARDAAGRGLSVTLAEQGDLAQATSSSSTKLFHGGLRYLEYFEFRLVREALREREVLLRAMPHISWPMRFVLPWDPEMRFDSDTPTSRILSLALPWMKGRRPAWLIRLGLFLYDHLGARKLLPGTATLGLRNSPEGAPLREGFRRGWEYSDGWVEDSRLVALNARDAADRGATILTRTKVVEAQPVTGGWRIETEDPQGHRRTHHARLVVNAAGPWVSDVLSDRLGQQATAHGVRLVRGSHVVVRRLFDHDKAYFLQGQDGRIIFAIPYQEDFTLIGTTEAPHPDPDQRPVCTEAEQDYLLGFANRYFRRQLSAEDVVWTYSGVRPLYEDGASSATAATREYVLALEENDGAPMLNVFGGKITTYRRLAEQALARIATVLDVPRGDWTAGVPLAGGDFLVGGVDRLVQDLCADHPFLTGAWAKRLVRAYGTEARQILEGAQSAADLGRDFGATLTEREVLWLMEREFALTAEDVLWRRGKLGLRVTAAQAADLQIWMDARLRGQEPAAAE
ncbi:glycerol-3-phosphate dehydrogenase [Salipiger manganoxidans]|uniref:glycerol-3-phosphate dehydrogenase n=2 Tax=Salipiger marinus TaxID=555512 RepID=UPI001E5DB944|nr:glycerol-3-phosphate dehydrogenase [Salipiger manganoxidans]MCD1619744.1 glycerol-3-phosphate dehydrogenase [Salipiger manganoxidans]